ncbi:hypothetical protein BUALT_Bualt16G0107000 [Buddleja alternifolia]|uniref:Uncharacterized protein n=2 Tax=Magnoliopsida TaxID=3398 RepID=A0AAV6WH83_9LAMI|nr:hypothetical protein BUALT_Bualt16G0107000 [Buddleja alternifolia]
MGSKREEERNEKIIRGLMKLPPNRRCINCNSLGPQYVCTNFWTFVCTTCSGIHREFTHRVKSVSMAKFTFQEVDALQKGGNQRARELYLKAWDPQRQRLPDNSNVDKVRELIKNVYVDKKYAVEKSSDRPPRDPQSIRNHEDETRRASSYHSYSQSPPYDFQYEERRYGKHAPSLTRKGSDRGIYEGKLSNFLSPSRFNDQANDDRFANEGSYPRASDYSVSSGGDPFRSDVLSPSSQRDTSSVPSPPQSSAATSFQGLDLFDAPYTPQNATSSNSKLPDNNQSMVPVGSENSAAATVSSSGGNIIGNFNPFSLDQSSSHQNSVSHEPSASTNAFWHDGLQNVETATNNTQILLDNSLSRMRQKVPNKLQSTLLPMLINLLALAGVHSLATEHKVTNPFDIPFDSDMESSNMSQFWDMSALQTALPNSQAPAPYVGGANQSWFPQNPVSSYVPGGVAFDPPSGSLGFISGQTPRTSRLKDLLHLLEEIRLHRVRLFDYSLIVSSFLAIISTRLFHFNLLQKCDFTLFSVFRVWIMSLILDTEIGLFMFCNILPCHQHQQYTSHLTKHWYKDVHKQKVLLSFTNKQKLQMFTSLILHLHNLIDTVVNESNNIAAASPRRPTIPITIPIIITITITSSAAAAVIVPFTLSPIRISTTNTVRTSAEFPFLLCSVGNSTQDTESSGPIQFWFLGDVESQMILNELKGLEESLKTVQAFLHDASRRQVEIVIETDSVSVDPISSGILSGSKASSSSIWARTTVANTRLAVESFDGTGHFGMWQSEVVDALFQQGLYLEFEFLETTLLHGKAAAVSLSEVCAALYSYELRRTSKVWVYTMKTKDEVFEVFLKWKKMVETQTDKKVNRLRTDNGGEFRSDPFQKFCEDEGIVRHFTIRHTPQQNGVAERMNRTLLEKIRCLLSNAGLGKEFWAEAVTYACHLVNRLPSTAIDGKTPLEKWFGKPAADYDSLHVFGSAAYYHVKESKLDPRAKKVVFMGITSGIKGYRLWCPETKKIIFSRDVTFDESTVLEKEGDFEEEEVQPQELPQQLESIAISKPKRTIKKPARFDDMVACASAIAADDEMQSLHKNRTWELVSLPKGTKAIGCKWVFAKKERFLSQGDVRYKARLVAKGYAQKEGIEPEGFKVAENEILVCKLQKSLYELKQSPRQWYKRFDKFMMGIEYTRSTYDHCVYLHKLQDGSFIYLLLYVDDMLTASPSLIEIEKLKTHLKREFEMKDLGEAKKILGMEIFRDRKLRRLCLTQKQYLSRMLRRFGIDKKSKPVSTPFAPHFKLSATVT